MLTQIVTLKKLKEREACKYTPQKTKFGKSEIKNYIQSEKVQQKTLFSHNYKNIDLIRQYKIYQIERKKRFQF